MKNWQIKNQWSLTPLIYVASQQYKYGEIKYPGELAINVGFGALEGYFGIFGGIGWNATVGAASNVGSALTAGKYYHYDHDHQVDMKTLMTTGGVGFVVGGGAKALEVGKFKPVIDFITQKKIK